MLKPFFSGSSCCPWKWKRQQFPGIDDRLMEPMRRLPGIYGEHTVHDIELEIRVCASWEIWDSHFFYYKKFF